MWFFKTFQILTAPVMTVKRVISGSWDHFIDASFTVLASETNIWASGLDANMPTTMMLTPGDVYRVQQLGLAC